MKTKEDNSKKVPTIAILGAVFLLILLFTIPLPQEGETVSLSELAHSIDQENVSSITVIENQLKISYKEGEDKIATKGAQTPLTESLINLGASPDKIKGVKISFEEPSGLWSVLGPLAISLIPSLIVIFIFWKIMSSARTNATQALDFTQAKARLFGAGGKKDKEETSFDDVGGLVQAKQELKEIVDFLQNPEKYFKIGAQIPRGVLLVGPPGTGKTLLARAVANEAEVPFFSISGSEFIELFVGVGASRARSLFSQAKKAGKAIIFIDELDSIGKSRGRGLSGGGLEEREQTLNQILTEMDGFDRSSEVIVMGATNKPEALDPALLRPGRFDRRIVLDPPDIRDREKVLEIHAQGKPLAKDVDLREIAERTPGFSGADLESLVNEAAISAARENKREVTQSNLIDSIEKVMLGPERKSHLLSKDEKKIAAFHEAGHALVASSTGSEKVRKVSIIARGLASGYTLKMPEEEKRLKTRTDFINELATLFGGYVAEQMTFGEASTGARNDLSKATHIAQNLVKEYGMSNLGPISYGDEEFDSVFEKRLLEGKKYSEQTAQIIDKEVREIIREGFKKAERTLRSQKDKLSRLAETLIEKETIEKELFEKIIREG